MVIYTNFNELYFKKKSNSIATCVCSAHVLDIQSLLALNSYNIHFHGLQPNFAILLIVLWCLLACLRLKFSLMQITPCFFFEMFEPNM